MVQSLSSSAAVLTCSDRSAAGISEDLSGPLLAELLARAGFYVVERAVLSDDRVAIAEQLQRWTDQKDIRLICTTGGTGLAPRDVTPEATRDVIRYEVPGIAEAMRALSIQKTPLGMLSRAIAGVRGQTLIVNLPGSPKAVRECFDVIVPVLRHALELLSNGRSVHQADSTLGQD